MTTAFASAPPAWPAAHPCFDVITIAPRPHQDQLPLAPEPSVVVAEPMASAEITLLARRSVHLLTEALEGRRALTQVARVMTEDAWLTYVRVAEEASTLRPLRVESVRVQQPHGTCAEIAAHVRAGERSVALALRLEARADRWVCTSLETSLGRAGSLSGRGTA